MEKKEIKGESKIAKYFKDSTQVQLFSMNCFQMQLLTEL